MSGDQHEAAGGGGVINEANSLELGSGGGGGGGGSGDEHEDQVQLMGGGASAGAGAGADGPPKKPRYHRHTAFQIQQMEK
jgi:hypothetical protein